MTELIWEGKYKDNKKVAPVRISLPFQTIETINESAADRNRPAAVGFASGREISPEAGRNRLIWSNKNTCSPTPAGVCRQSHRHFGKCQDEDSDGGSLRKR